MRTAIRHWKNEAPLVIGHRGASSVAPENTLSAFRRAVEQGADAIEFDAKLSSDGAVVIHHDRTLDRTTNGTGPVSARSLRELKQLDAGSSFHPSFSGETIPTLEEVIETVGSALLLNIELTNYAHPRDTLPEKVIEIVTRMGMQDRVLLSSFNPYALRRVRRLAPNLLTGLLLMPQQPGVLRAFLRWRVDYDAYHPHLSMLAEGPTHTAAASMPVNVWTVNEEEPMQRCIQAGVSGIITDFPDRARRLIG